MFGSVMKVWVDNIDFVKEGDVLVIFDLIDVCQVFEKVKIVLVFSVC